MVKELLCFGLVMAVSAILSPEIVRPSSFSKVRSHGASTLYTVDLPAGAHPYATAPLLLDLHGSHHQVGQDYAALMHNETVASYNAFIQSMYPKAADQELIAAFLDYCWNQFLLKYTPQEFLDELAGMTSYYEQSDEAAPSLTAAQVAARFYTVANMPADTQNIIAMLEDELEPASWPLWLRVSINTIIKLLEKYVHSCDAYGVWGSRTQDGLLYSSRNLDWNKDTGVNTYKLITFYHITGGAPYATLGYAVGLGALAGMSSRGITVSEMNLDNSRVSFSGPPFPLRLRYVLEKSTDLKSAMAVWDGTNNTNSFNFLVGSAPDTGAYALETIRGYTAVYGDNSPVERAATYDCPVGKCDWTTQTGLVHIGRPLKEAVFRTNHAMDPEIMLTQESLFNDTIARYNLLHDLFTSAEGVPINDAMAVAIVATLGTKGPDFHTCEQSFKRADNTMSIAYAPGDRGASGSKAGRLFVAWEGGSGATWRPAACMPYVVIDFDRWM